MPELDQRRPRALTHIGRRAGSQRQRPRQCLTSVGKRVVDQLPHQRIHGAPNRLLHETLPLLTRVTAPLLGTGELWCLQLDTYEREVERYGGDAALSCVISTGACASASIYSSRSAG